MVFVQRSSLVFNIDIEILLELYSNSNVFKEVFERQFEQNNNIINIIRYLEIREIDNKTISYNIINFQDTLIDINLTLLRNTIEKQTFVIIEMTTESRNNFFSKIICEIFKLMTDSYLKDYLYTSEESIIVNQSFLKIAESQIRLFISRVNSINNCQMSNLRVQNVSYKPDGFIKICYKNNNIYQRSNLQYCKYR